MDVSSAFYDDRARLAGYLLAAGWRGGIAGLTPTTRIILEKF